VKELHINIDSNWRADLREYPNQEIKVYHRDGWLKHHLFTDEYGLRHGECIMYREDGEIALRDLYVHGVKKNAVISDPENRLFSALKYGVPLIL